MAEQAFQLGNNLGDTVSTHTSEIDNLNKELDRVKKLEESTVTTIISDKAFTTISETNGGYLEDVKIEGKTLIVNSDNEIVEAGTNGAVLKNIGDDVDEIVISSINGNFFDGKFSSWWIGNEFVKDNTGIPYSVIAQIEPNYEYYIQSYTNCFDRYTYAFLDSDMNVIYFTHDSSCIVDGDTIKTKVAENNTKYLLAYCNSQGALSSSDKISITRYRSDKYVEPKQNKKQILYYNPTTQTWGKPVLREWDSIEKHSDGKYYYHKRSEEIVLNGSEDWLYNNTDIMLDSKDTIGFYRGLEPHAKNSIHCISTHFKPILDIDMYEGNVEGINLYAGRSCRIRINKSKLSPKSVKGFKSWLQSNPVAVVYQLAQEEVYECVNLDLIIYQNETNLIVNSGAVQPKLELKVLSNISNVVKLLQEKVSALENKFIEGLKQVLAGDMMSLAYMLYPEDFEQNEHEVKTLEEL